ncbi:DUF2470 domain-containing protein [Streptomyces sp. MUM 203J]|uniref:DUF2470 domain-containing protein n=1 Tax=Streptomyces sp. MUM 203J TaxID=2791990 RepID=UPI001F046E57|nr:DUF2470 domain-containing protein [Streptomyces sp. MUM 203J]MCH0543134.1 DUF2470 domain-containing protein [Streptomyces sp. MUM 203J]
MSTAATADAPVLTAAERVRSVLARAVSLTLTTDSRSYDLIGMHTIGHKGRIRLHPRPDDPLTAQLAAAPRGSLAALLEFTDIAPTAVRDRVRARVTVSGWLAPPAGTDRHGDGLRLDTARVTLRTTAGLTDVGLDELALAEPDPLAADEAAMLTHLADAHGDLVAGLLRLAGPRLPRGAVRALPLALDRYGLTLRCEQDAAHHDLRLLFPSAARDAAEAGAHIRRLLTAPLDCPHQHPAA